LAIGAGGEYLPPVVTELTADISDLIKKVEEAKALLKSLAGDITIGVNFDVNASRIMAIRDLLKKPITVPVRFDGSGVGLKPVVAAGGGGGGDNGGGGLALVTASFRGIGNIIHWIIAGGAELLAVLLPALVALGSAAMVLAQGFGNVYQHMTSLYTATEATANMFHQTVGSVLGLHSALQQAQNAANPIAYSVLGAAVMVLRSHFQGLAQTGLEVSRVFQTFTSKLVMELQGSLGGQLQGLLSNMVGYLIQFAQIIGNLVHALINFAGAMPGLAHVLLGIADAISRVILWISQLPHWLITTVMVFEEIWRWGPLAGSAFMLIGRGIAALGTLGIPVLLRFAAVFKTIFTGLLVTGVGGFAATLGQIIGKMEFLGPAAATASKALIGFEATLKGLVAAVPVWGWLLIGATILGGIFYYNANKAGDATARLAANMQQAANAANGLNIFTKTASNLAKLYAVYNQASAATGGLTFSTNALSRAEAAKDATYSSGLQTMNEAHAAIMQQTQDTRNAAQAVNYLSKAFGTSFAGALAIGDAAGIQWDAGVGRMSQTAQQNLVKIDMLKQGYLAMGAPMSAVGKDMTALGIQAALQSTRVQQLTAAWQAWMQLLTGGTSALAQFEGSLANIGQGIANVTNNLAMSASGTFKAGLSQFAKDLTTFTGQGSQAWQNFNQVVAGSAEQFINWMQTAGAAGVVSGGQMTAAIKGVVLQLLPFAADSAAARAELTGLAAQTGATVAPTMAALSAWAKGGMNAKQLGQFVGAATVKMSNMQQVASTLNVVMGDVSSTFANARIAVSGLNANMGPLVSAIQKYTANSSQAHAAMIPVIGSLAKLGLNAQQISGYLQTLGIHESVAGVQAVIAGHDFTTMGGQAKAAAGEVQWLNKWVDSLHSKTITITTIMQYVTAAGRDVGQGGHQIFHASGTKNAQRGFAWVGEHGPELMYFHGGEGVVPSTQTGAALAGAGGSGDVKHEHHIYIDGKKLFSGVKAATYTYNVNNGNRKGGRVSGTLVP
jgi:hypothetical protein